MFHYSSRVIDEPKMSEIRILNLCLKKTIFGRYLQTVGLKPVSDVTSKKQTNTLLCPFGDRI